MELLPTGYHCINCTLVPTVQSKFSRLGRNDGRKRIILSSYHDYALGPELNKRIRRHLKQTNDSWRVNETLYINKRAMDVFILRG
ncbi:hypothetical protein BTI247_58940 (plasmid) [Bacillus thuringiensis Bt18247]|uniref:Uncharacterized protein n=1 Tax=Bacillus thuringiensis Bt18247 TaxID=1423143 RepID=A0A9W3XBU9_BACTU|nr:hypothetical protein BTI247_58940 [Bacillus thuringiensis Bt18247]